MGKKDKEQPEAAPEPAEETAQAPMYSLVTAAQAGALVGRSPGFFSGRAKRGVSLPKEAARVGRQVFYEIDDVAKWWETAKDEKVTRGRRSNLPEGVKSRASLMLLDEEWEKLHAAKGDSTIVDFVREAVLKAI